MDVTELFRDLAGSSFRDLAGTQASARIPVSRSLVNAMIADGLRGTTAPIRRLDVHPRAGDRFDVTVAVTWPFVPSLTVAVAIEEQPRFPASPMLVLHWSLLGAFGVVVSRFIESMSRLPPGIRLDGDRLVIDIPALAARFEAVTTILPIVTMLELHTIEDAVVIEAAVSVPNGA